MGANVSSAGDPIQQQAQPEPAGAAPGPPSAVARPRGRPRKAIPQKRVVKEAERSASPPAVEPKSPQPQSLPASAGAGPLSNGGTAAEAKQDLKGEPPLLTQSTPGGSGALPGSPRELPYVVSCPSSKKRSKMVPVADWMSPTGQLKDRTAAPPGAITSPPSKKPRRTAPVPKAGVDSITSHALTTPGGALTPLPTTKAAAGSGVTLQKTLPSPRTTAPGTRSASQPKDKSEWMKSWTGLSYPAEVAKLPGDFGEHEPEHAGDYYVKAIVDEWTDAKGRVWVLLKWWNWGLRVGAGSKALDKFTEKTPTLKGHWELVTNAWDEGSSATIYTDWVALKPSWFREQVGKHKQADKIPNDA